MHGESTHRGPKCMQLSETAVRCVGNGQVGGGTGESGECWALLQCEAVV